MLKGKLFCWNHIFRRSNLENTQNLTAQVCTFGLDEKVLLLNLNLSRVSALTLSAKSLIRNIATTFWEPKI